MEVKTGYHEQGGVNSPTLSESNEFTTVNGPHNILYALWKAHYSSTILTCHVLRLILLLICKQATFYCDIIFKIRLLKISVLQRIQFEGSLLKSDTNLRQNSKKAKISEPQTLSRVKSFQRFF